MVKCILVILTLTGNVVEKIGVFQSCATASAYAATLEEDVVLLEEVSIDSCRRSLVNNPSDECDHD